MTPANRTLDLGDMSRADGDTECIEPDALDGIMLHEIAAGDPTVTSLLFDINGFLREYTRGLRFGNTATLDLGHHHQVIDLIEQDEIRLAFWTSIPVLEQHIAALLEIIDSDHLADHAEFAGRKGAQILGGEHALIKLSPLPHLPDKPTFAGLWSCRAHGGSSLTKIRDHRATGDVTKKR